MRIISLLLFMFFWVSISQAQSVYSKQNLRHASQEEIKLYLGKSNKLKKSGAILSIAGPVTALVGFALGAA